MRIYPLSSKWLLKTGFGNPSRRLHFHLALDIGFALVKSGEENEQAGRGEHDDHEKKEVACALQLHCVVRVLHQEIDRRREEVTERNCAQVRAHHQRLEFLWSLGIGELQVSDRNHYLGGGEHDEGQNLPYNM